MSLKIESQWFLTSMFICILMGALLLTYAYYDRDRISEEGKVGKGYTKYDFVIDYYDRTGNYFARVGSTKSEYLRVNKLTGGTSTRQGLENATVFRSFKEAEQAIERTSAPVEPFTRKPFKLKGEKDAKMD